MRLWGRGTGSVCRCVSGRQPRWDGGAKGKMIGEGPGGSRTHGACSQAQQVGAGRQVHSAHLSSTVVLHPPLERWDERCEHSAHLVFISAHSIGVAQLIALTIARHRPSLGLCSQLFVAACPLYCYKGSFPPSMIPIVLQYVVSSVWP